MEVQIIEKGNIPCMDHDNLHIFSFEEFNTSGPSLK